jgi:hypothetical protein
VATLTVYAINKRTVTARYGMYGMPVQANTVAEIRRDVGELWMIPGDAVAYCGNTLLFEDDFLPVGACVEFHRPNARTDFDAAVAQRRGSPPKPGEVSVRI